VSSTHAESSAPFELGGRLTGDLGSLDEFARELGGPFEGGQPATNAGHFRPRRVNADPATADKDLAKLVLALVDLVRRLLERQAGRRVNAGSLTEDQVERMGETFLKLDRKMAELKIEFGLEDEDLDVSLGVIRDLL
jgi:hypothetical protein